MTASKKTLLIRVLGIIALVAILGGGGYFLDKPRWEQSGKVKAEAEKVQSDNDNLTSAITILNAKSQKIDEARTTAQALGARFPGTADLPGLFNQVQAAASAAGLPPEAVTAITPSAPAAAAVGAGATLPSGPVTGGLATMSVALNANGGADQLRAFLQNLENMPRSYLVSTVTLAGASDSSGGGSYTLSVTGTMFVQSAPVDPGKTATAPAGK